MSKETIDSKPFLELLKTMSTGQIWAVLVALAGITAGAVSIGYQFGEVQGEIHDEEARRDHFDAQAYREKAEFLELYLRYNLAMENERFYFSEEEKAELEAARESVEAQLFAKTRSLKEGPRSDVYEVRNRATAVAKGAYDSTIRFFDGSTFPLPEPISDLVNGNNPTNPRLPSSKKEGQ